MPERSPRDVFDAHLDNRVRGRLDADLDENYADDVVLLTQNSQVRGKDGMRVSADRLASQLPDAQFVFEAKKVEGPYAFLVWRARSPTHRVECGADGFLIRDGRIAMQTIHYRLLHADGTECPVQESPGLDRLRERLRRAPTWGTRPGARRSDGAPHSRRRETGDAV
jgi:hypothetical protein